jgi:hypothetical protein
MMVRLQGVLLELLALFVLKVGYFLFFVVFFCLLNSMTILQAKNFSRLQLQWILFLHFF